MNPNISAHLSPAAAERFTAWREGGFLPAWASASLDELVQAGAWGELEDRFFRDLRFGTGGLRGRTIGRQPAPTELGPSGLNAPAHPAIGANTLNDITVAHATVGLHRQTGLLHPRLVIAHDVRFFSRRFAELVAQVWTRLGGEAYLFAGPRSTPQLSFTVRALGADAGVVLTASHNPPHDNGYKVYSADGGSLCRRRLIASLRLRKRWRWPIWAHCSLLQPTPRRQGNPFPPRWRRRSAARRGNCAGCVVVAGPATARDFFGAAWHRWRDYTRIVAAARGGSFRGRRAGCA